MKNILLLLFFPFLFCHLHAQTTDVLDTVYLMSGKTVAGVVKDSTDEELKILTQKKDGSFKADFIDMDLVFSVKYRNGQEAVFYKQDTLFGNYFTPQEVRYFMAGERDADRFYHCPFWSAGAFLAGFAGGYTNGFVTSFLTPFAYAGATTLFRIRIAPGSVSSPENIKFDTYVLGYEKEARKRRLFRTLIWGGVGMVAGFTTSSIVYKNQQP